MLKSSMPPFVPPTFYASYNDDGDLISVGVTEKLNSIEISEDVASDIISGAVPLSRYSVISVKTNNEYVKRLVEKKQLKVSNRAKIFDAIVEDALNQQLIVEWDKPNKQWKFILDVDSIDSAVRIDNSFLFYITPENNREHIITTLEVEFSKLLNDKTVTIPFTLEAENNIHSISIITRLILESYGLRVIDD